jgi:hypothetical protein
MWRKLKNRFQETYDSAGSTAEVGWLIDTDKAAFIWPAPQQFDREVQKAQSSKAVQLCPAIIDFEARFFVVTSPVDLHLRMHIDNEGRPQLQNVKGDMAPVDRSHLADMVQVMGPKQWRHPSRPVLQLSTPYRFLSDEPTYLNQMPPFLDYQAEPWPGVMIGGRMPIHIWPRPMMWAFEWCDLQKDLIVKRGDPWFYLFFETPDMKRKIRIVEAEMTPELRKYCEGLDSVTNYMKQTFSLFSVAMSRRPKKLLNAKKY